MPPRDSDTRTAGYTERETYQLSKEEYIVIATHDRSTEQGLRLVYLRKTGDSFNIRYASSGAGDSYILRPSFLAFEDSTVLILTEMGSEYSWGVDIYELKEGHLSYLGNLDVADENFASIIPHMIIHRNENRYRITLKKKVILHPGGENEETLPGSSLEFRQQSGKLVMIRKK